MLFSQMKPYVRFAAQTSYLPNKDFTMAYDNRLLYVINGNGIFYLENKSHKISAGSLMLYPCGVKYYPCTSKGNPLHFVTINYDYTQNNVNITHVLPPVHESDFEEKNIVEKIKFSDLNVLEEPIILEGMQIIEKYLLDIVNEFCEQKNHYSDIISGLMTAVLGIVAQYSTSNLKISDKVNKILNYIHLNYDKDIDYDTIAREFNYHPNYINQLVKMKTGMSLHKYIMSYKISSALKKIMATDLSIAEIAYQTGFKNPNHFSVCFKKEIGKTPSYFKNRNYL